MASSPYARHVVVGVDGSGLSDRAVLAAFRLARAFDREVDLVHAAEVPYPLWQHVDAVKLEAARSQTLERLAGLLSGAGLPPRQLAERLHVVQGPPARALLARAKEVSAGLIVLGRHHDEGLLSSGDTVRAVLARSDCPVWVQAGEVREVHRILVPLDLSEESLRALELAREYARVLEARIDVLHCFVRPELGFVLGYPVPFPTSVVDSAREAAETELRHTLEPFEWEGVPHGRQFVEGDPAREILAASDDCDLIVMGTHGRTGLSSAILGSVAAEVLRGTERPVLAIREPSRSWLT